MAIIAKFIGGAKLLQPIRREFSPPACTPLEPLRWRSRPVGLAADWNREQRIPHVERGLARAVLPNLRAGSRVSWCLAFGVRASMIGEAMRKCGSDGAPALLALFVGGLAAAGCAEQLWPEDSAVTPASTASCRSMIRPPELDPAASPNEVITIAETDQEASVVDVAVDGTGSGFVGRLSVLKGVGTVELGCETLRVAVHGTFQGEDGPNFIALAAAGDRLYTLQWQCASGTLGRVWFDSTDGTEASSQTLRGSCQENSVVRSRVRFSPLEITLPGFTNAIGSPRFPATFTKP